MTSSCLTQFGTYGRSTFLQEEQKIREQLCSEMSQLQVAAEKEQKVVFEDEEILSPSTTSPTFPSKQNQLLLMKVAEMKNCIFQYISSEQRIQFDSFCDNLTQIA